MLTDQFAVGEVVNSGAGIAFEVVELLPNEGLKIRLTYLTEGYIGNDLKVGEEYILIKNSNEDWIFNNSRLPWFILAIRDGEKSFEFYR